MEPALTRDPSDTAAPLLAFGAAARRLAEGAPLDDGLHAVAAALARALDADVALVRVLDGTASVLEARAVFAVSSALGAELQGSRVPTGVESQPGLAAERLGLGVGLQLPIMVGDAERGRLEVYRRTDPFTATEEALARLAAEYAAIAIVASGANGDAANALAATELLRLGGDALAAGLDEVRTAEQIAQLAAEGTGAVAAAVWRVDESEDLYLAGSHGLQEEPDRKEVVAALESRRALSIQAASWTLQLGQPPLGALQLRFEQPLVPSDALLDGLSTFAARAAHALRTSERMRQQSVELERSRALVAVVGQAIAQLSLVHTLETAIARVAELVDAERLAVYLVEGDEQRLVTAAGRGLAGPHTPVGERLLALAQGPLRGRDVIEIGDAAEDSRLGSVREQLSEAGIEAAVALPLRVREDLIGLLAVYPDRGSGLSGDERALVAALAAQLAVAVQNARLHEQVKRREEERRAALEAEQNAARTLGSLYEISRTFAQSLSLDTTLEAIVRSMTELLGIDAVGIRMPDERQEALVTQKLHVRDERMAPAVEAVLRRPQPFSPHLRRLFASGAPLLLDPAVAHELGGSYGLLVPFLEKGSTTAIVPLSTQAEVVGTLTLLSLDPARPLGVGDLELAMSVGGQAALALENARLYQQQKRFAETMQRSLLPRGRPQVDGIEVGYVYESSARVDVGGDVYDFLTLDDGRLAVALGDVTGHGIDATADMALAKYVFRSLAREHPEPADFLAAANEVVVDEVALSKFITMLYLTVDPASGAVACASAGHPRPRVVAAGDGRVSTLRARGLALGIESDQVYEQVGASLAPGAAVVLYTDGVIEARREGELYGDERLDALLATHAALPAKELAEAVVADCKAFTGGELSDDCAVVVIRRTA
ncbi:MAG TPA: SpoIIE family protein phosphatase [Gaiellaceae bacterium]|nr:SpoIIE family protein phosphatase [Gaiellaceae bacterium]